MDLTNISNYHLLDILTKFSTNHMVQKIYSTTLSGLRSQLIEIEIDISPSIPTMLIVGLPDKAVQESRERVKTAIAQSGFEFPMGKITVNLAPANLIKAGTQFDLPIAVGILKQAGYIKARTTTKSGTLLENFWDKSIFAGELSLDGSLRSVNGVLSIGLYAVQNNFEYLFVPKSNLNEARMVQGIKVFAIERLSELVGFFNGTLELVPVEPIDFKTLLKSPENTIHPNDMAYIKGQTVAKRALEIAASGGHNAMFVGQPGSGKTLLAKSFGTILPMMSEQEILEVTQVYSIAGLLDANQIMTKRPFRSPHHTASHISMIGGGLKLRPGEVSLSHRGVLFLDEFPEFGRDTLEALRQPLEDGVVQISRAVGSVQYPAKFCFLAAANPTPSGFESGDALATTKSASPKAIARYQAKFSGPIMDRIDIFVQVNRPSKDELQSKILSESSYQIATRVQQARDIQIARFGERSAVTCNSEMNLQQIQEFCQLDKSTEELMSKAIDKFKLSARSYMRILKLSRTIADLDGNNTGGNILFAHLSEALQFRNKM